MCNNNLQPYALLTRYLKRESDKWALLKLKTIYVVSRYVLCIVLYL